MSSVPNENATPRLLWISALVITLGASVTFGYNLSALNPLLVDKEKTSILHDIDMDDKWKQELATSMLLVGAAIGSFLGVIPDTIGHKRTLQWIMPMCQVGGTVLAVLGTYVTLLIGRFVCGIGTGLAAIIAPVLLAEIAAPDQRGFFVSFHQIGITIGLALASIMGVLVRSTPGGWRWSFAIGAIPVVIMLLGGYTFLPNSPRWLLRQGLAGRARGDAEVDMSDPAARLLDPPASEASDPSMGSMERGSGIGVEMSGVSLGDELMLPPSGSARRASATGHHPAPTIDAALAGSRHYKQVELFLLDFRPLSYDVKAEMSAMVEEVRLESSMASSDASAGLLSGWGTLLEPRYRFQFLFGLCLISLQVLSGANTIIFYSSTIFGYAGVDNPVGVSVLAFAVNIVGTLIGTFLIDRVGRRSLLIAGFGTMCVSLIPLGFVVQYDNLWGLSLVCLLLFMGGFAVGPGVATWVLMGEVVPTRIRSRAYSVFMAANWILVILLAQLTLTILDHAGNIAGTGAGSSSERMLRDGVARFYWFFDVICAAATIYAFSLVPRTEGRSLEEVQEEISRGGLGSGILGRCCTSRKAPTAHDDDIADPLLS